MFIKTIFLRDPIAETGGNTPSAPAPVARPTSQRLTTPQMPSTPSKADLEVKFSSDEMPSLEVDNTKVTVDNKNVEPTNKVEPKGELEKKEVVEVEKKEEKKEETGLSKHLKPPTSEKPKSEGEKKQIEQVKVPEKSDFDYTQYTPQEQHLLKNMSKEARAFAANLHKENKELAKEKGSSYLQHPQAFTLNPEYQKLQEDSQYAFKEGQYWQAQLEACKKGNKIKRITAWNENGSPVLGPELEPTDALEEECRLSMQSCITQGQQMRGQLQQYPKQYQQRMQQDLQGINAERANRFQWVAEPKLMDYSINTDTGEKTIKTIKDDFKNIFPSYLRGNPGIEVASDLMVAMILQKAELDELRASSKVTNTKMEEVKRGEPSSEVKPAQQKQGVNGSPAVFTTDGMD